MGTSSIINLLFFIPILSGSFFSGRQLPPPSFITAHHFSSYFYSTILDRNVTEKIFLINWASLPRLTYTSAHAGKKPAFMATLLESPWDSAVP